MITYSAYGEADWYAKFVKCGADGSEFFIVSEKTRRSFRMKLRVPGMYNVQNALCAIALCSAAGFDEVECARALEECRGVNGRMSVIHSGEFTVIKDYAHTDDALEKTLSSVKQFAKGKVICVFGAAGERDSEKRPMMARAVEKYSDYAVITSDNPAHEDPCVIIREVASGMSGRIEFDCEADRRKAIGLALARAEATDVVVLCGKGHENYQIIGDEYLPFDEEQIVAEIMSGKGN